MIKLLAGIPIVIVAIILGLQIDDDLEPAVIQLLEKSKVKDKSSAYLYLMGFHASEKDDPYLVGRNIYHSIRRGEETYLNKKGDFDFDDYPEQQRLPLPEGQFFCKISEKGCLSSLFQEPKQLEEVLRSNATLLNRYYQFNNYNDFATLARPLVSEPFPPYQYIAKASRLVILSSIKEAQSSNDSKALSLLSKHINSLRKQLVLQDTLIGKLVFLMQLSETLDVAYLVSRGAGNEHLFQIPNLTKNERDFEVILARELAMFHDTYRRRLDNAPEIWEKGGSTPSWVVNLVFKPNITVNSSYPVYRQAIEYASLSQAEFSEKIEQGHMPEIRESKLRNLVGTRLNRIGLANYNKYIARFYDVDTKITLFNATVSAKDIKATVDLIKNPYYPKTKTAYLSEKNQSICFDGPLPDERNFRCLRIAI